MENNVYDLIIIGSGPAGLTASIYASCYHLKHLVIGGILGGQLQLAPDILNFPGFESISGKELTQKMFDQAIKRGGELVTQSVTRISSITAAGPASAKASAGKPAESAEVDLTFFRTLRRFAPQGKPPLNSRVYPEQLRRAQKASLPADSNGFEVETQEGKKYQAKAVILATGTERRKLNIPGEVEYTGRGVHYCATCEKFDYDGKVCAVIGGANSAVQAAVEIAQAASKVYIIYRGSQLRGDPIWLDQVEKNPKIEVLYDSVVSEITGDGKKVTGLKLKLASPAARVSQDDASSRSSVAHSPFGEASLGSPSLASPAFSNNNLTIKQFNNDLLPIDKIFIEIGGVPGTALVILLGVKMDKGGYIEVNERLATNIPGIFAAGDLVSYGLSIEQISSAVGLGARAAASAFAYLKQEKAPTLWGGSQIKR